MADVRSSMLEAVGNTPVVELGEVVPRGSARVLVKLEYYNPTGSYKDRMALAMVEEAEKRGDLRPGMSVVEYTGGSTGSSLAFVCAVKGYAFRVVSSDAFAREKLRTMEAFGAELTLVPSQGGRITPDLIPRMIEKAREMAREPGTYATDQFNNADSLKGYVRIGLELLEQTGGALDGFCAAVGTAGMTMGVSRALKEAGSRARVVILEPASSAVISTGKAGAHHVEGVGVGFVPPLLDRALYDEAWGIDEQEARAMARRLAREEGIFTGTSGGLNVVGALRLAAVLGEGHTVATVACDSGLKYLAGDLYA
ncbi:Cysteine synthase [Calidithermus terrae]|uniref:Cysteine synthase n=1 Tax=Calidithermus terrae TaxID=1408545 RepID=A0A399F3I8_9DEIN|nr:cysteine synthase family protein [Calidithermus terrae]RIH90355.1 Cysteine synthase [Calidithermus terrae]